MKKILLLALVAATLTACSSDSEAPQAPVASKQPIVLGTGMPTMRSNSQTLQATELEAGTTVGVYIYFKDETTTNTTYSYGYKNIAYTVSGTAGDLNIVTSTDQPYYPDVKTQNVDIYAFAPRATTYTGTAELNTLTAQDDFSTTADQTTDANYRASDFVWGKKANVAAPSVATTKQEITMDHMLSKVNINIAAGSGVNFSSLSGAEIRLNGVKLLGTVNLTTGAVTLRSGTNAASTVTLTSATSATGKLADTTTDCYTSSAVIIPQDIAAADDFIEVELSNGSVYKYKTTATTTFAAKTKYTYDITLSVAGIQLTTTISDWTNGGTTPGTAE